MLNLVFRELFTNPDSRKTCNFPHVEYYLFLLQLNQPNSERQSLIAVKIINIQIKNLGSSKMMTSRCFLACSAARLALASTSGGKSKQGLTSIKEIVIEIDIVTIVIEEQARSHKPSS